MKITGLPLLALVVLPLSVEPAHAPADAGRLGARLARVVAVDAQDVAEMQRLCELALRHDLTRAQRAVLDARCAERVRAVDARAHGARAHGAARAGGPAASRTSDAAARTLTARGLGLERLSLASPEHAARARAALAPAAGELARLAGANG